MARVNVTLSGTDALVRVLARGGKNVVPVVGRAIHEEALLIFDESQSEVPYRYGYLAGSGMVDPPVVTGSNVEVQIGYGGAAAPYALMVHESRDKKFRNGRKSKYLEDPVMRAVGRFGDSVGRRVDSYLRSGL
jgi:hypothetical protein